MNDVFTQEPANETNDKAGTHPPLNPGVEKKFGEVSELVEKFQDKLERIKDSRIFEKAAEILGVKGLQFIDQKENETMPERNQRIINNEPAKKELIKALQDNQNFEYKKQELQKLFDTDFNPNCKLDLKEDVRSYLQKNIGLVNVTEKGIEGPMFINGKMETFLGFDKNTESVTINILDPQNQKWELILENKDNTQKAVFEANTLQKLETQPKSTRG